MGKWFGQASEIEELRTENRRLKEQVATLEARLRAAYADAGITALADPSSPTASTDPLAPATASSLEVSDAEMELLATGPKIAAVKAYKDRTGVSLKAAKAAIDAVPVPTSAIVSHQPRADGCRTPDGGRRPPHQRHQGIQRPHRRRPENRQSSY